MQHNIDENSILANIKQLIEILKIKPIFAFSIIDIDTVTKLADALKKTIATDKLGEKYKYGLTRLTEELSRNPIDEISLLKEIIMFVKNFHNDHFEIELLESLKNSHELLFDLNLASHESNSKLKKSEIIEHDKALLESTAVIYILEYLTAVYFTLLNNENIDEVNQLIYSDETDVVGFKCAGVVEGLYSEKYLTSVFLNIYSDDLRAQMLDDYYEFKLKTLSANGDVKLILESIKKYVLKLIDIFLKFEVFELTPVFPEKYGITKLTDLRDKLKS